MNPDQIVTIRLGSLWNMLRTAMQVGAANPEFRESPEATVPPVIEIYEEVTDLGEIVHTNDTRPISEKMAALLKDNI